ncbi:MAG: hypothetical protein HY727_05815 [Candidatus Rokubacteria bacterium]|nr:hypothetical protein [Candidatus Rokubacteria bacterium]
MPFLTDLDSRAAIKGSRDPLGLQAVWTHFGRKVVGNLTTVSNSVRGFTTLLLGYYFAEQGRDLDGTGGESILNAFLKFEQLAAYTRLYVNHDRDFRGIDRVAKRLGDAPRVAISAEPRHQILSNQKIYGLWGLFSVPARTSGLLEREDTVLTPGARAFVREEYVTRLDRAGFKDGKAIVDVLRGQREDLHLEGRHKPLARAVAGLFTTRLNAHERERYRHYLVYGGDRDSTRGRQRQLGELLLAIPSEGLDLAVIRGLARQARRRGHDWTGLAECLDDIVRIESLIAPAANVFELVLARQGLEVAEVAADLRKQWGTRLGHLRVDELEVLGAEIAAALGDTADRWLAIARGLAGGDYESVLRLLVEQNEAVMKARQGAAWVRLTRGRFEVRYREESAALVDGRNLRGLLRHSYFIDSLWQVAVEVTEVEKREHA